MLADRIARALEDLRGRALLRHPRVIDRVRGACVTVEGREVVNFASNDYLGLGQDSRLLEAARGVEGFGWAPASSRLLSGTTRLHVRLEEAIAEFLGVDAAICFPSGYMANVGMLSAVAGPETTILSDERNHASLIDACRLSRAKVVKIPHGDLDAYRDALRAPGEKIVLTDSVFSMDGDLAPLGALEDLVLDHGADLIVDDAHGFGVFGEGRGAVAEAGIRPFLRTLTLSKAAGCVGGVVAGDARTIEYLRTQARTFMFTTAPPAALCAAALEALRIIEEGTPRRRLWDNLRRFSPEATSPILIRMAATNEEALSVSERLWEAGFWVPAIRPPAVPSGAPRLRISLSALHEPSHLDGLRALLRDVRFPRETADSADVSDFFRREGLRNR